MYETEKENESEKKIEKESDIEKKREKKTEFERETERETMTVIKKSKFQKRLGHNRQVILQSD